jgi:alkanesulfonate monooxygenase SsuD/methylene tetrahydromethanopterin reductase-like flavin-dependent oxidoreductase (luciferase family)
VLFGLDVSTSAAAGNDPVAAARAAEEGGFDFVSASDHPCGTQPSFETWTMLSWIAAATSRIRVATRVLGVPYRPPAMVAKMAETLHRLSGGRLILGLGGGYSDDEFGAFGLGTWSARDKVDCLEETVRIVDVQLSVLRAESRVPCGRTGRPGVPRHVSLIRSRPARRSVLADRVHSRRYLASANE